MTAEASIMTEAQPPPSEEEQGPSPKATKQLPAATLSKSWSISSAHVPTYTGGKVTHCNTKGIHNLYQDQSDSTTPFLLLPVGGDLALVDAQRGTKARTIRNSLDSDDDEDDGMDADAITSYALSWNDEILITCSPNHLIRQYTLSSCASWNPSQPAPVYKTWGRSGHTLPVTHMEFHLSNVFLATGSVDGIVRIWDVRGGFVTHVLRPMEVESGGMHAVTALSWRYDSSQLVLAIGRANGSTAIHDLRQEKDKAVLLKDHVSAVTCMEWEPSFAYFVTTGRDAVIHTYKVGKGQKKSILYQRVHTIPIYEQVEGMVMLPSSKSDLVVATAGSKGVVRLWKATIEQDAISGFECTAQQQLETAFGEDRGGYLQLRYLAHGDTDEQGNNEHLVVADAEHNLSFLSLEDHLLSVDRTIVGHNDEILDLKVIPSRSEEDGDSATRIAVATNSAQVRLFDLKTFSCTVLDGHTATVLCVDVSPCGRYLATCGKDKTMRLWLLKDEHCVATATGHTEAVGATALSRKVGRYEVGGKAAKNGGGAFCVTASKDRTLKRWNLPGADELNSNEEAEEPIQLRAFGSTRAHDKDINIVSVAPNDSLIATGSQDKTVKLWRATDLSLQATLKGHKRGVWDCQFSPYDRVVATCSGDRTVKLWSLGDYSCVRTFQGHVASALRVRFLSGGLQLVSCGADGLVKLWTIRTNECEATMDGHSDKVWALDLSPDGSTLVSGGADSQIVVWQDTTQEQEDERRREEEENIMMEQRLSNHLRHNEYEQALEIALEMDKPRQALKVLTSIVENAVQKGQSGLSTLQRHVKSWPMDRTTQVLRYCREWNTRARNCHIAMLVVKAVVTSIPAHELAAADGLPEVMAGITPYAERHFDRLDRLYTSSYLLDFTLFSMEGLESNSDMEIEKEFSAWESQSKLVLPPKRVDGRIQVGGATLVGARDSNAESESDDEVLTLGDSESSSSSSSSEDESSDNDSRVDEGGDRG